MGSVGNLASLLFLISGATALIYQVVWTRSLTLILGASQSAVSIVLGAFMAGLALGGFCFGRICHRWPRPLRTYGLLEVLIGFVALLLPGLLHWGNRLYVGLAANHGEVDFRLNAFRVVLAFGILVLPTFFMGGTLPVLVHLLVRRYGEFGVRLSWLYGVNTLGAVIGAVSAGFLLLPALGVWHTQLVAIAVNFGIGALAILADARWIGPDREPSGPPAAVASQRAPAPPGALPAHSLLALRLAFFGTAVCGMCALALEVLWTRAISVAAGTSTYSFTVMLAAFLIGIALGSWLHGLFPLRRIPETAQFGLLLLLIGVSGGFVTQWIPHLPQLSVDLNARFSRGAAGVASGSTLLLSFAVMLVPCILMGAAFPIAGQARARLRERFGSSVGDLLGLNTLGCVAGALLAGFVLVPRFGLQRSLLIVAAVNAVYGLLVLAVAAAVRYPRFKLAIAAPTALLMSAAVFASASVPPWDARLLGAFCNNLMAMYHAEESRGGFEGIVERLQLLYYHEGLASIVSVIDNDGTRSFIVMGKAEASDSHTDLQHERLLGHLPVLLHPNPRSAAVIGLGAGVTLGGVAAHDSIERITLVEIEPGVRGVAEEFSDINGGALNDPRLRIVYQDGRNHLLTTRETFDVITSDPIHPWAAGSSYLYTVDYYRVAAARLNDGGIMCHWLPLYELSEANLRSIVATFNAAFPHVTVWQTALDAVLIGSNRPLSIDPHDLARRLAAPRVAAELTPIGLGNPLSFLAELAFDEETARQFGAGAVVNTDDNLYLEFSAPLSIGTPRMQDNVRLIDSLRTSPRALLTDIAPLFESEEEAAATFSDYMRAKSETVAAQLALRTAAFGEQERVARAIRERVRAVLAKTPDYGRGRSLLAVASLQLAGAEQRAGRVDEALALLHEAAAADPFNPDVAHQLARALQASGAIEAALAEYARAQELRPRNASIGHDRGAALLAVGRKGEAVLEFRRAVKLRPKSTEARYALAVGLTEAGEFDAALEEFAEARHLAPPMAEVYDGMARVLLETQRYGEALRTLHEGLGAFPQDRILLQTLVQFHLSVPDAQLRDPSEAVRLAHQLTETGSPSIAALELLGAAQAASGDVQAGLATARRAVAVAESTGDAVRAARLAKWVTALEERLASETRR